MDEDIDVGEVVGDDRARTGNGPYRGVGDIDGAKEAVADFAEPGGAIGAGFGTQNEDFKDGVSEDASDFEDAIDSADIRQS